MRLFILLNICLILLNACAKESFNSNHCPPIINYSHEEQIRAAEELEKMEKKQIVGKMITDYSQLRQIIRACENS